MSQLTKRPIFWIIALFIALPFLAFPEIIFGGQTLYWSDLSWIHYPRRIFAASEWLGSLPTQRPTISSRNASRRALFIQRTFSKPLIAITGIVAFYCSPFYYSVRLYFYPSSITGAE